MAQARDHPQASSAAFEVAVEALAALVAVAAARIDSERSAAAPDYVSIATWEGRLSRWREQLHDLHPADTPAVRSVLTTDAPLLRALNSRSSA